MERNCARVCVVDVDVVVEVVDDVSIGLRKELTNVRTLLSTRATRSAEMDMAVAIGNSCSVEVRRVRAVEVDHKHTYSLRSDASAGCGIPQSTAICLRCVIWYLGQNTSHTKN